MIQACVRSRRSDAIEFLLAEHLNHRRMCRALEAPCRRRRFRRARQSQRLLDFIRFDLTLHVIDEEEDFFPLLRQRCLAEDEIEDVLDRLTLEHAEDKALSVRVRDVLNACLHRTKAAAARSKVAPRRSSPSPTTRSVI